MVRSARTCQCRLAVIASCGICSLAATAALADFVGVVSEILTDADTADLCVAANGPDVPFPLTVCNVSVQFDEDNDRMLQVAFADLQVMDGASMGRFFHHPFGGDAPYLCSVLKPFPDLVCDSYITIGEKCVGEGSTTLNGDFSSAEFNDSGHIVGGWFNAIPFNGLGDAVNYPDGRVLILQAVVAEGLTVQGTLAVLWQDIGNPDIQIEQDVSIFCGEKGDGPCGDCPTDADDDGATGPFDLASLLGSWGPVAAGHCLDANDDGEIGPFDLATLLAAWGPCP